MAELDERKTCARSVSAFVALFGVCADERLRLVVDREYPVADAKPALDTEE
jgi:hypothetical protein